MLLLTLYIVFTTMVGIGVVRLSRFMLWRSRASDNIGGQPGGYGQMTIRTQQGFITLFDNDQHRRQATTGGAVVKRFRKARSGNVKRPWGW
jgi:hypothetical protein